MEQMSNMKANIAISENNKLIVTQKRATLQDFTWRFLHPHFAGRHFSYIFGEMECHQRERAGSSSSSSNVSSYVSWFSTRKRNEFNDDDDNDDVGLCCLRDTNITTTTGKWDKFQDFVSLPRSTSFVFIHWIVLIISNDDGWLVLFFSVVVIAAGCVVF